LPKASGFRDTDNDPSFHFLIDGDDQKLKTAGRWEDMKIIGLTGGIATGKSTVTNYLREQGFTVIDADDLAREVVEPGTFGLEAVGTYFGPEVLTDKGVLNRESLRARIFDKPAVRLLLERILHPLIQWRSNQEFEFCRGQGMKIVFYDAPLIFEKNIERRFDEVICVAASPENQVKRLTKRSQLLKAEAEKIISSQLSLEEKCARSQHILHNDGSISELKKQVDELVRTHF